MSPKAELPTRVKKYNANDDSEGNTHVQCGFTPKSVR